VITMYLINNSIVLSACQKLFICRVRFKIVIGNGRKQRNMGDVL
jgi:hypothetical protein